MRTAQENFDYWMSLEKHYAALEQEWVRVHDYVWAERCHKLRWRCMDLALQSLNGGVA